MAATSGKMYPYGLQYVQALALNAFGVPSAPSTAAYAGSQIVGAQAFEPNFPEARRIYHTGDNRVLAASFLPPLETGAAILRAARNDFDVYELLTGNKKVTIGEATGTGYGTDKTGDEPDVCLVAYQRAKDATAKTERWRCYVIPVAQAYPRPSAMNEGAVPFEYSVSPSPAIQYPWGIDFASGTEGFTEAQMLEFMTEGKPRLVAWKADNSATEFSFETAFQATSTAKIHVITKTDTSGVTTDITGSATKAVDKITIAGPLAAGIIVTAFYEHA